MLPVSVPLPQRAVRRGEARPDSRKTVRLHANTSGMSGQLPLASPRPLSLCFFKTGEARYLLTRLERCAAWLVLRLSGKGNKEFEIMAGKPKLYYFDGRGKMESIRWLLAAAGVEFEEEFLETREQYEKLLQGKFL
uniref:Uncharacterized protein n=1 Tax=Sphaerodactylus townsendi TaxID=933632 RepID=A0ACB8GEQ2_9SAUR